MRRQHLINYQINRKTPHELGKEENRDWVAQADVIAKEKMETE